jgi:hypothetical protein
MDGHYDDYGRHWNAQLRLMNTVLRVQRHYHNTAAARYSRLLGRLNARIFSSLFVHICIS